MTPRNEEKLDAQYDRDVCQSTSWTSISDLNANDGAKLIQEGTSSRWIENFARALRREWTPRADKNIVRRWTEPGQMQRTFAILLSFALIVSVIEIVREQSASSEPKRLAGFAPHF